MGAGAGRDGVAKERDKGLSTCSGGLDSTGVTSRYDGRRFQQKGYDSVQSPGAQVGTNDGPAVSSIGPSARPQGLEGGWCEACVCPTKQHSGFPCDRVRASKGSMVTRMKFAPPRCIWPLHRLYCYRATASRTDVAAFERGSGAWAAVCGIGEGSSDSIRRCNWRGRGYVCARW